PQPSSRLQRLVASDRSVASGKTIEAALGPNTRLVQLEAEQHPQDRQSVACAVPERNRRRLGEVTRRYRRIRDAQLLLHELRDDLLIEDELVRVHFEAHCLESTAAVGAITRVI